MKKKIIAYNRVAQQVQEELSKEFDVHFFDMMEPLKDQQFVRILAEAEGIIGLNMFVNQDLLDMAPVLKIVSNVSVGYDNLNLEAMNKHHVMATHTPGVLTDTVADAIFALILATARRTSELDQYVKNGQWKEYLSNEQFGTNVHHKTLGIIGLGRIGQAIAKRAHCGFDMDILYHNRSRNEQVEQIYNATYCSLDKLLTHADFVCLMTPLTPETQGMLGIEKFKRMKRSAIFINGSRGRTIIEKDLIQALQHNKIRAAGLDVYEQEPVDPSNPLLHMKNVVTLPHIGSSTTETELEMSQLAAQNLVAGLRGLKPPHLINSHLWNHK